MRRALPVLLLLLLFVPLAGCTPGLDRVERSAAAPATLDADSDAPTANRTVSFDTTVELSLSGDVEVQGSRPVTATVLIRRYDGPTRVGLVSSPAVQPLEEYNTTRDPFASLSVARQVELALGERLSLERTGTVEATLLGRSVEATRYDAGDTTVTLVRVRDGADFVTAVVTGDGVQPALSNVTHAKK